MLSSQNPWAEWDSFENFDEEFDEIGTQPNSSYGVDIWNPIVSMFLPMSNVNIDMLEKWSDDFYPELYCGCIEATETACYEESIVELWAEQVSTVADNQIRRLQKYLRDLQQRFSFQGAYNKWSDLRIQRLTQQEILDTINTKNTSQIFMQDKSFLSMLGNIRYNEWGQVVGAGAVEVNINATFGFGK